MLAVRWYLRFGLSYHDLEELLAEQGIEVERVSLYRWVQRFTPLSVEAARLCRHAAGDRWFVEETYVKVSGAWRYVYRAVDHNGQVVGVYLSKKRSVKAATRLFSRAIRVHGEPMGVTTNRSLAIASAIVALLPGVHNDMTQYANNRIEADPVGSTRGSVRCADSTGSGRQRDHQESRVCAEPATWTLQTRKRRLPRSDRRCGVRRTRASGLRPRSRTSRARPLPSGNQHISASGCKARC